MRSVEFPLASRTAAPPANITNTMYDVADIKRANNVPFGMELAGSFKSPDILALLIQSKL